MEPTAPKMSPTKGSSFRGRRTSIASDMSVQITAPNDQPSKPRTVAPKLDLRRQMLSSGVASAGGPPNSASPDSAGPLGSFVSSPRFFPDSLKPVTPRSTGGSAKGSADGRRFSRESAVSQQHASDLSKGVGNGNGNEGNANNISTGPAGSPMSRGHGPVLLGDTMPVDSFRGLISSGLDSRKFGADYGVSEHAYESTIPMSPGRSGHGASATQGASFGGTALVGAAGLSGTRSGNASPRTPVDSHGVNAVNVNASAFAHAHISQILNDTVRSAKKMRGVVLLQRVCRGHSSRKKMLSIRKVMQWGAEGWDVVPKRRSRLRITVMFSLVKELQYFRKHSVNQGRAFCSVARYQFAKAGEWVYKAGASALFFYVIDVGEVWLYHRENDSQPTHRLTEGNAFGDVGLVDGMRMESVKAGGSGARFLVVEKAFYLSSVRQLSDERIQRRIRFLQRLPLFKESTSQVLKGVAKYLGKRSYSLGEQIVAAGDVPKTIFFIATGAVIEVGESAGSKGMYSEANIAMRREREAALAGLEVDPDTGLISSVEGSNINLRFTNSAAQHSAAMAMRAKRESALRDIDRLEEIVAQQKEAAVEKAKEESTAHGHKGKRSSTRTQALEEAVDSKRPVINRPRPCVALLGQRENFGLIEFISRRPHEFDIHAARGGVNVYTISALELERFISRTEEERMVRQFATQVPWRRYRLSNKSFKQKARDDGVGVNGTDETQADDVTVSLGRHGNNHESDSDGDSSTMADPEQVLQAQRMAAVNDFFPAGHRPMDKYDVMVERRAMSMDLIAKAMSRSGTTKRAIEKRRSLAAKNKLGDEAEMKRALARATEEGADLDTIFKLHQAPSKKHVVAVYSTVGDKPNVGEVDLDSIRDSTATLVKEAQSIHSTDVQNKLGIVRTPTLAAILKERGGVVSEIEAMEADAEEVARWERKLAESDEKAATSLRQKGLVNEAQSPTNASRQKTRGGARLGAGARGQGRGSGGMGRHGGDSSSGSDGDDELETSRGYDGNSEKQHLDDWADMEKSDTHAVNMRSVRLKSVHAAFAAAGGLRKRTMITAAALAADTGHTGGASASAKSPNSAFGQSYSPGGHVSIPGSVAEHDMDSEDSDDSEGRLLKWHEVPITTTADTVFGYGVQEDGFMSDEMAMSLQKQEGSMLSPGPFGHVREPMQKQTAVSYVGRFTDSQGVFVEGSPRRMTPAQRMSHSQEWMRSDEQEALQSSLRLIRMNADTAGADPQASPLAMLIPWAHQKQAEDVHEEIALQQFSETIEGMVQAELGVLGKPTHRSQAHAKIIPGVTDMDALVLFKDPDAPRVGVAVDSDGNAAGGVRGRRQTKGVTFADPGDAGGDLLAKAAQARKEAGVKPLERHRWGGRPDKFSVNVLDAVRTTKTTAREAKNLDEWEIAENMAKRREEEDNEWEASENKRWLYGSLDSVLPAAMLRQDWITDGKFASMLFQVNRNRGTQNQIAATNPVLARREKLYNLKTVLSVAETRLELDSFSKYKRRQEQIEELKKQQQEEAEAEGDASSRPTTRGTDPETIQMYVPGWRKRRQEAEEWAKKPKPLENPFPGLSFPEGDGQSLIAAQLAVAHNRVIGDSDDDESDMSSDGWSEGLGGDAEFEWRPKSVNNRKHDHGYFDNGLPRPSTSPVKLHKRFVARPSSGNPTDAPQRDNDGKTGTRPPKKDKKKIAVAPAAQSSSVPRFIMIRKKKRDHFHQRFGKDRNDLDFIGQVGEAVDQIKLSDIQLKLNLVRQNKRPDNFSPMKKMRQEKRRQADELFFAEEEIAEEMGETRQKEVNFESMLGNLKKPGADGSSGGGGGGGGGGASGDGGDDGGDGEEEYSMFGEKGIDANRLMAELAMARLEVVKEMKEAEKKKAQMLDEQKLREEQARKEENDAIMERIEQNQNSLAKIRRVANNVKVKSRVMSAIKSSGKRLTKEEVAAAERAAKESEKAAARIKKAEKLKKEQEAKEAAEAEMLPGQLKEKAPTVRALATDSLDERPTLYDAVRSHRENLSPVIDAMRARSVILAQRCERYTPITRRYNVNDGDIDEELLEQEDQQIDEVHDYLHSPDRMKKVTLGSALIEGPLTIDASEIGDRRQDAARSLRLLELKPPRGSKQRAAYAERPYLKFENLGAIWPLRPDLFEAKLMVFELIAEQGLSPVGVVAFDDRSTVFSFAALDPKTLATKKMDPEELAKTISGRLRSSEVAIQVRVSIFSELMAVWSEQRLRQADQSPHASPNNSASNSASASPLVTSTDGPGTLAAPLPKHPVGSFQDFETPVPSPTPDRLGVEVSQSGTTRASASLEANLSVSRGERGSVATPDGAFASLSRPTTAATVSLESVAAASPEASSIGTRPSTAVQAGELEPPLRPMTAPAKPPTPFRPSTGSLASAVVDPRLPAGIGATRGTTSEGLSRPTPRTAKMKFVENLNVTVPAGHGTGLETGTVTSGRGPGGATDHSTKTIINGPLDVLRLKSNIEGEKSSQSQEPSTLPKLSWGAAKTRAKDIARDRHEKAEFVFSAVDSVKETRLYHRPEPAQDQNAIGATPREPLSPSKDTKTLLGAANRVAQLASGVRAMGGSLSRQNSLSMSRQSSAASLAGSRQNSSASLGGHRMTRQGSSSSKFVPKPPASKWGTLRAATVASKAARRMSVLASQSKHAGGDDEF